MNFTSDVAYHFCPGLPAAFTQPGTSTLAHICRCIWFVTLFLGLYQWRHLRGHLLYSLRVEDYISLLSSCHLVAVACSREPSTTSVRHRSVLFGLPACVPPLTAPLPYHRDILLGASTKHARREGRFGKGQNMCHAFICLVSCRYILCSS